MTQCISCLQATIPKAVGRRGRNKGKGRVKAPADATAVAAPTDSALAMEPPATPLNIAAAREGGEGVVDAPTPTSTADAGARVTVCLLVCCCFIYACLPYSQSLVPREYP